eukprot:TRINITY_DN14627_c0_g4_i1.p1 TRINITY_DN14627_c0_g4~~TRINITY_DN14627_c0_g4_i1.p1  ORF type:complete len:1081 (-),score=161.97 TRINITY_DN14627_c0_g4_i1:177-3419(-)
MVCIGVGQDNAHATLVWSTCAWRTKSKKWSVSKCKYLLAIAPTVLTIVACLSVGRCSVIPAAWRLLLAIVVAKGLQIACFHSSSQVGCFVVTMTFVFIVFESAMSDHRVEVLLAGRYGRSFSADVICGAVLAAAFSVTSALAAVGSLPFGTLPQVKSDVGDDDASDCAFGSSKRRDDTPKQRGRTVLQVASRTTTPALSGGVTPENPTSHGMVNMSNAEFDTVRTPTAMRPSTSLSMPTYCRWSRSMANRKYSPRQPMPSARTASSRSVGRPAPRNYEELRLAALSASPDILEDMIKDAHPKIRIFALDAISNLAESSSEHNVQPATVLNTLKDKDRDVRHAAMRALEKMGAIGLLGGQLDADDWRTRAAVAEAIGSYKSSVPGVAVILARLLKEDQYREVRAAAADTLATMGEAAGRYAKSVAYALRTDESRAVRAAAARALGQMGKAGVAHANLLADNIKDTASTPELRMAATIALGRLGPPAASPQASSALARRLKDDDPELRLAAMRTLVTLDEARVLAELLSDTEGRVHEVAIEARCSIYAATRTPTPNGISSFPDVMFKDDIRDARRTAAEALGNLGEAAAPYAGVLAVALTSYHRHVRCAAAEALGRIGVAAAAHAGALAAALKDEAVTVRQKAARALNCVGNGKMLADLLQDADPEVREAAAQGLGSLGEDSKAHTGALLDALKDRHVRVRRAAAEVLRRVGIGDPQIAGPVAKAMKDSDPQVRQIAAEILRGTENVAMVPYVGAIAEALQIGDDDKFVCRVAEDMLGNIGEAAAPHAEALVDMLKKDDWDVSSRAAEILGKIGKADILTDVLLEHRCTKVQSRKAALHGLASLGEAAAPHVTKLALLLKDESPEFRRKAQSLIIQIGEAAGPHADAISDMLKDPSNSREVRFAAAFVLSRIEKYDMLGELLRDSDPSVRQAAAHGLGSSNKAAASHASTLVEALKDKHVRQIAVDALRRPQVVGATQISMLTEMIKLSHEKSSALRKAAATVLAMVGQAQLLSKLLRSSEWRFRQAACFGLGSLGEAAQSYTDDLVEVLKDDRREVISAATLSLGKIFPRCKHIGVAKYKR